MVGESEEDALGSGVPDSAESCQNASDESVEERLRVKQEAEAADNDVLREMHVRELLQEAEVAEKLDVLREMHVRELLEEAGAEDAIPQGGFWQLLDIECETIGEG